MRVAFRLLSLHSSLLLLLTQSIAGFPHVCLVLEDNEIKLAVRETGAREGSKGRGAAGAARSGLCAHNFTSHIFRV